MIIFQQIFRPAALLLFAGLFCFSCQKSLSKMLDQAAEAENPAAPGFDLKGSDPAAINIANEVMRAQGGRAAWDATKVIRWTFFGGRTLTWDKQAGLCRIDWLKRQRKVIINLQDGSGKVSLNGVEQTNPDSLVKYLDLGRKVWINDSYWLFMPFKLKDSGVTLKSLGEGKTADGKPADLLQLTFKGVGVTPDNKYHVWVDKKTRLVTQWAYFEKYTDEKPEIQNPWGDYRRYGDILLSSDRGKDEGSLAPISVMEKAEVGTFEHF